MPLPNLVMPSSLPAFLIAGHDFQYQSPFANIDMGTGESRRRRVVTRRPHIASCSLLLEQSQAADFQLFYRDGLKNGERSFAARVAQQGFGTVWYTAQFVAPYNATALHLRRWRIDTQLRLIGEASETGPTLGAFAASSGMEVVGTGELLLVLNVSASSGMEVTS